jgi:hypothetical protein
MDLTLCDALDTLSCIRAQIVAAQPEITQGLISPAGDMVP